MKKGNIIFGVLMTIILELLIITITVNPETFENKMDNTDSLKKVVYRKLITVESLINKFDNILIQNELDEINLDYLSLINQTYYVGLFQDIIFFITPLEDSETSLGDRTNDIVYQTGIIVPENTDNFALALLYYQYLIEANNEFIFDANQLVKLVVEGNLVERNNGLILGGLTDNNEINLFIERKYNS